MENNKTSSKYMGVQIVSKIVCDESDREPISSAWDKDRGLLIPSSHTNGMKTTPIIIGIPRDVCKDMVKDLMEEILKEQAGAVMD